MRFLLPKFFNGEAIVDLELIVPDNWSAAANLPLELEAPGRYILKDYVIGSEDLYLSLLNKDELMFGLNSRSALFGWTWPAAAISFIGALFTVRRRKRWAAGLVISGYFNHVTQHHQALLWDDLYDDASFCRLSW